MHIGYIGLGKMGFNMVERLLEKGHTVIAFDPSETVRERTEQAGARTATSAAAVVESLPQPRILWIMVPHRVVDEVLAELTPLLSVGDTVIDGGNSLYKESIRRAAELKELGVHFLDVGVSGGPAGARNGACMMVGGERAVFDSHEALFKDLSVDHGYGYIGAAGAGHFVKMVHNGIEYGMMQSLAEGFAIMNSAQEEFDLNLKGIADVYNHGSVVESRLVGWLKDAFDTYGTGLEDVSGTVAHTGEGAWTVEAAKERDVAAPIIDGSLEFRKFSAGNPSFTGKVLSALRNQFGGHSIKKE